MKLIKDGQIIDLPNENHAEAFLTSGWTKYEEPAKKPAPKAKSAENTTKK